MRKIIIALLMVLIISTIGIVVEGTRAERMIRVYGTVTIDGEGVEGADITVRNIERGEEVTTTTNSSGYYETFIKAVDHNNIKVSVKIDGYSNDKTFVNEKFQSNYEINFEFESTPDVKVSKKIYGIISMLKNNIRYIAYDCLVILIIIILIIALKQWHKELKYNDKD